MTQQDHSHAINDRDRHLASGVTDEMLDRYLAGRAHRHDRQIIEQLIASTPAMAEWVASLREIQAREDRAVAADLATGWERLTARIGFTSQSNTGVAYRSTRDRRRPGMAPWAFHRTLWYSLAGAVASVVLLMAGLHMSGIHLGGRHAPGSLYTTYTTTDGQRANITLSDGSVVALNVASRLDVPVNYARGDRALRLKGEALFTVLHHDGTPFTVLAGGTTTRVLGTSFVVRRYDSDTAVTVAVRDGKVAVRSLALTAGRQATISHDGGVHIGAADPGQFSFVSGVLTIPGMSLLEAIPELNRWYDADIRLGSQVLGAQRIHGKLAAGSLAELQAMLEWTYKVRVIRDGRVLTLFPR